MGGVLCAWARPLALKPALAALVVATSSWSCATSQIDADQGQRLDPEAPVVLLPMVNASEAPLAGERVEAILTTLLRQRGIDQLSVYSTESGDTPPELDDSRRYARALAEARRGGMRFGVTGTVVEWRYRPGIDDEPAVSVSLRVVDVNDGRVLWSASGSRGARGSVAALAQKLLRDLTDSMPLGRR